MCSVKEGSNLLYSFIIEWLIISSLIYNAVPVISKFPHIRGRCIRLWALYSVPLVCMSVSIPLPLLMNTNACYALMSSRVNNLPFLSSSEVP